MFPLDKFLELSGSGDFFSFYLRVRTLSIESWMVYVLLVEHIHQQQSF